MRCGVDGAVDVESPTGVVEIDERTASGFGDETQGLLHDVVAVAGGGGEDISREAVGMNADEDGLVAEGLVSADIALDQRQMAFAAVDFALVGDDAELAVRRGQRAFCNAEDVALVLQAVTDELGDGEHFEPVLGAEFLQVGNAGHGAVVVHDFADDAGGDEAGETGEIDGGFGLAGADEDATAAGAEREDVSGTGEVVGGRAGVDGDFDGVGAVGGGDAGGDAFAGFDGLSKGGAEARGVLLGHGTEAQVVGALLGESEADEAASVTGHEVDGLGSNEFGGEGEVAFVFAVFVVDDYDHASGAELFECSGDVGECGWSCHEVYCQPRLRFMASG